MRNDSNDVVSAKPIPPFPQFEIILIFIYMGSKCSQSLDRFPTRFGNTAHLEMPPNPQFATSVV